MIGPVGTSTGQFVCKVTEKIPADMNQYAAAKAGIVQSLEQQKQSLQDPLFRDSIVTELKKRGKIKMNDAAISRIIGSYEG